MSDNFSVHTGPEFLGMIGGSVEFPVPIIGIFVHDNFMYAVARDGRIWRSQHPESESWERWNGEVPDGAV